MVKTTSEIYGLCWNQKKAGPNVTGLFENWLPFVDAYRTLCRPRGSAFRLILEEIGKSGLSESPAR